MRATNRIVATLVALVLLAVSVIAVVEIILAAIGKSAWIVDHVAIADDLHQRTWQDGLVVAVAIGAVLIGILLLFVALKPGAPSALPLQTDLDGVTVSVTRRSLEHYVAGIAAGETGVDSSSVSARRGRVGISASTTLRDPGDLRERVHAAVASRLESLRPTEPIETSVSIRNREDS